MYAEPLKTNPKRNTIENQLHQQYMETIQEPNSENRESEKHNYKLTDEDFIEIYNHNFGLYTQTARMIEEKYGIKYSRQSVWERSRALHERLTDQNKEMIDEAKTMLFKAITQNSDLKTKLRASLYFLSRTEYKL